MVGKLETKRRTCRGSGSAADLLRNGSQARQNGKKAPLYSEQRWDHSWKDFRGTSWKRFQTLRTSEKVPLFMRGGRIFDCLFSQQFDRQLLDHLCALADRMRKITKHINGDDFLAGLLKDKRALLYFAQPSTRTFLSFHSACNILGIKIPEIRDSSTSSEFKGESSEDTVRTFSSYVHMIIMRHKVKGFAEKTAWHLNAESNRPIPVINAGSGADQHPTQALLDVYTIGKYLEGGVDGKHIVMVGDLKRGRTVRSLSYLMRNYRNVRLTFVSPSQFKMEKDILAFLKRHRIPYQETDDFESAISEADAVYMTRIQDEHDKTEGESKKVDNSGFHFLPKHLRIIKKHCIIMHPLPRRQEIHPTVDKDKRAVYWRQERNGMWMRTALIAHTFGADEKIW